MMMRIRLPAALLMLTALAPLAAGARISDGVADALHRPLDGILDAYVRDGLVYYRALKGERRALDAYVASLDRGTDLASWPRAAQVAFWLNAYNALVLRMVIDHYPIRGRARAYPADSIRQIPGAFERLQHRVGGRTLTLDALERDVLGSFEDPRLFLAIGRGSVGGGRLRSEAFTGSALDDQLQKVAAESATRRELLAVDKSARTLSATPIISWRAPAFIAAYADRADARFEARSPIERAIIAFAMPHLLPSERALLESNDFRIVYHDYDWRLNDLTGGGPR